MDNAPIHKKKIFKEYFEQHYHIIFNVAYCPDLNPIENFFGSFKYQVKQRGFTNEETLLKNITQTIKEYEKKNIAAFIYHSDMFIEKSLSLS